MSDADQTWTFDEWVEHVFNPPATDAPWYRNLGPYDRRKDRNWCRSAPAMIATYLARLFENPTFLTARYTPQQLGQGFDHIIGLSSGYFEGALHGTVPRPLQERWLRATFALYRDLFAHVCSDLAPPYSDDDVERLHPLNGPCTHLFNQTLTRIGTSPWYQHLVPALLDTLQQILTLECAACQTGALSGLAGLIDAHPDRVRSIISTWLARPTPIPEKLGQSAIETLAPRAGEPHRTLMFDEWVRYVFDRPVTERKWHRSDDENGEPLDWWEPEPVTVAGHLARLFEDAAFLAQRYSSKQLDQGFWLVLEGGRARHAQAAMQDAVPIELQQRWVRAIFPLFRDLFAKLCPDYLSHARAGPDKPCPLNRACYMFWDLGNLYEAATSIWTPHLSHPIFEVLEQTLGLDSMACQESALHGLGHAHRGGHPLRVERIIDDFLRRSKDLHPALRAYAEAARCGRVQ